MDEPVIGIALSSGGAAGLAHIGVIEVLADAGIDMRCVAGTSAGAMVGAAYAAGKLDGLRDRFLAVNRRALVRLFDPSWSGGGLFGGRRAMDMVQPFIGENIEDLPRRFAAIATNLVSGTREVIRNGSVQEAVRMSIAIPGVFTPVLRDGRPFVDGALVDPIPVSAARELGAAFVIAVSVIPPPYAAPLVSACQPPARLWPKLSWQTVREWFPGGVESVTEECSPSLPIDDGGPQSLSMVLTRASVVVQSHIAAARLREQPPDFLIQPDSGVGVFDFDRAAVAIEAGRVAAAAALPGLREALDRAANVNRRRSLLRLVSGRQAA
jgi:NTE family protein